MAGWQCLITIFSFTLISASALPPDSVNRILRPAPRNGDRPTVLKVDQGDNEFRAIAEFARDEFNVMDGYIYKIIQYLTANAQLFEGVVYVFDVILGKTDCPSTKYGRQAENCPVIQAEGRSKFYLCHFIVWSYPSPPKKQVLLKNCQIVTF